MDVLVPLGRQLDAGGDGGGNGVEGVGNLCVLALAQDARTDELAPMRQRRGDVTGHEAEMARIRARQPHEGGRRTTAETAAP